jgi:hypothetical protein
MVDMNEQKWDACNENVGSKQEISHLPFAYELEQHRFIQCEAFLLAERDGFKRTPLDYWLAAEKCVHQRVY